MLDKRKNYTKESEYNIIYDLNKAEFKLQIIGKEAGDMMAYIYGEDFCPEFKGETEVVYDEDTGLFNSTNILQEILNEAEKWDCEVYLEGVRVR